MPIRRKLAVSGVLLLGSVLAPRHWHQLSLHHAKSYDRAIAASIFRMIQFSEALGTACMSLLDVIWHVLTLQVLSHPTLFGLPTTDQIGLESLGIFWSLIAIGVAIPVACLPTLRPLFHGLSPESVLNSIRSMVSLSSINSKQKDQSRGQYDHTRKGGSFELASEAPFRHQTGFTEPDGSLDKDSIASQVWRLPSSICGERSVTTGEGYSGKYYIFGDLFPFIIFYMQTHVGCLAPKRRMKNFVNYIHIKRMLLASKHHYLAPLLVIPESSSCTFKPLALELTPMNFFPLIETSDAGPGFPDSIFDKLARIIILLFPVVIQSFPKSALIPSLTAIDCRV